jgi:hypothetical protein
MNVCTAIQLQRYSTRYRPETTGYSIHGGIQWKVAVSNESSNQKRVRSEVTRKALGSLLDIALGGREK